MKKKRIRAKSLRLDQTQDLPIPSPSVTAAGTPEKAGSVTVRNMQEEHCTGLRLAEGENLQPVVIL